MDQKFCSVCSSHLAHCFCYCNSAETLLCESCLPCHFSSKPAILHQTLPLTAYGHHRADGYFDRLLKRQQSLSKGKSMWEESVQSVDRCIAELEQSVNSVIEAIWLYARQTTEKLTEIRAELACEVQLSLEEAERTIYEDDPQLDHELSLCFLRAAELKEFQLFDYSIYVVEHLPSSVLQVRFSSAYPSGAIPTHVIPQIARNVLRVTNLKTDVTTSGDLQVSFLPCTVFCCISPCTVLAVGSWYPITDTAYSIDFLTYTVKQLQSMTEQRSKPGVVRYKDFVYVFGGNAPENDSCEKFAIGRKCWQRLENMNDGRFGFSPCLFNAKIYLLSPQKPNSTLETFDTSTETFETVPVHIPESLSGHSVSFFLSTKLVIFTQNSMLAEYNIVTGNTFRVKGAEMTNFDISVNNIPPVQYGDVVHWVASGSGSLVGYNTKTGLVQIRDIFE